MLDEILLDMKADCTQITWALVMAAALRQLRTLLTLANGALQKSIRLAITSERIFERVSLIHASRRGNQTAVRRRGAVDKILEHGGPTPMVTRATTVRRQSLVVQYMVHDDEGAVVGPLLGFDMLRSQLERVVQAHQVGVQQELVQRRWLVPVAIVTVVADEVVHLMLRVRQELRAEAIRGAC